jgi:hypothetical protein
MRVFSVWAAAFSVKDFSFENERLKGALELYKEGQLLVAKGDYEGACDAIMAGVFSGRKLVERMQQEDSSSPESAKALEWLVASYVTCAEARSTLGDWDKARGDAWAACMISRNTSLDALHCMLQVCESTDDLFGQLSVLKSIEACLLEKGLTSSKDPENGRPKITATPGVVSEDRSSLKDIIRRISQVEAALELKMNTPQEK